MHKSRSPSTGPWQVAVLTFLCIAGPCSIAQSQAAARVGDMHVCPMVTGLVPHVGGPILPPGVPTVLIGGMPAAVVGTMATCVGPPDTIVAPGAPTVLIGGQPAARLGDMTAHGGTIVIGAFTVLIGGSKKAEVDDADHASHPSPRTRSMDEAIADLEEQAGFLEGVLTEFGEDEAVRNALSSTYLVIAGLYEELGDNAAARDAHALEHQGLR